MVPRAHGHAGVRWDRRLSEDRETDGEQGRGDLLRPEDFGIGQLFWVIRDAVVVGDAVTGRIVLWSPSAERLFGYSATEALGQPIEVLVPVQLKDRHRVGLAGFAASGHGALIDAGAPVELPALRKGGEAITIELSLTPIDQVTASRRFVLALIRDATERKRAEAERLELAREQAARAEAEEAVRRRDEFLSIAAHELRNPVTVLKGASDLLSRPGVEGAMAERQGRLLPQIAKAADRLAELTDDLLDISRIHLGQLPLRHQLMDVAAFVHELGLRHREQIDERHHLALVAPAAPCLIVADRGRLEQVLANLLDNAIKYSPDGGVVEVVVRAEDAGVRILVRDEGIGLPLGATEEIFEPFGRAGNTGGISGMGLGLFICRSIVERHRGRIWAESPGEGYGTTVSVWLPAGADSG